MAPKPLPRPTAPPQPMSRPTAPEKAPEPRNTDAPVIVACALGRTADGRFAAALLRVQGRAVLESRLVDTPAQDALAAEEAWRPAAYRALYLGEEVAKVAPVPGRLVSGTALALFRQASGTSVLRLEVEDGRVEMPDLTKPAPKFDDGGARWVFEGRKLDAWAELDRDASLNLLRESLAERRRHRKGA